MKIANVQGFWGDSVSAPKEMAAQVPDLDFITLDYLAELSLAIMAEQRRKDPEMGFAKDFIQVAKDLSDCKAKIVTNAGGLNPKGLGRAVKKVSPNKKVAVITGDEVGDYSRVYYGAKPIVEALTKGADIVIAGRAADPSLTVAPAVYTFGWAFDAFDLLAQATLAGHLIECGRQVTGGMSTNWLDLRQREKIGFPIVEMDADGTFVVTKPKGSGGAVTLETVKEQMLYEIEDPDHYLSPDVILSLLKVTLSDLGENRILVKGAKGKPPPQQLKVAEISKAGFKVEGTLALFGFEAKKKARLAAEALLQEKVDRQVVECIGSDLECMLRIALIHSKKEPLLRFAKELASLVTSGPQGVTGYAHARPKVRPYYLFEPTFIEREKVNLKVEML